MDGKLLTIMECRIAYFGTNFNGCLGFSEGAKINEKNRICLSRQNIYFAILRETGPINTV